MPTADQVKALIRSHAEGDGERFYAIAMQVAAQAARQGHTTFAKELRDLVDQAETRAKSPSLGQQTPEPEPRSNLGISTYPSFQSFTRVLQLSLSSHRVPNSLALVYPKSL